jgi:peptidoglycan/LPS O-acetylase OafA/YrhL
LQKFSLDSGRRRLAFRAAALVYAVATIYFASVVGRALAQHPPTIRSANLGFAMFAAAASYGLWIETQWGKTLALLIALGTSSLGAIETLSVIVSHRGPLLGWILVFVVSTALTYLLSLRIFNQPPIDDI